MQCEVEDTDRILPAMKAECDIQASRGFCRCRKDELAYTLRCMENRNWVRLTHCSLQITDISYLCSMVPSTTTSNPVVTHPMLYFKLLMMSTAYLTITFCVSSLLTCIYSGVWRQFFLFCKLYTIKRKGIEAPVGKKVKHIDNRVECHGF